MSTFSRLLAMSLPLLVGGCATVPPPPALNLNQATIVPSTGGTEVDISGLPGGKAVGVGVGAGAGAGYGALAGGVACLATGPLFPLCVLAVIPSTLAVGAVTGAAVGGARADTTASRDVKTAALKAHLSATRYQGLLAERLCDRLTSAYGKDIEFRMEGPDQIEAPSAAARPWLIEVAVDSLGTEGNDEFAVRLQTSLRVTRSNPDVSWQVHLEVQSETELTIAQWQANDSEALNGVIASCLRRASDQLARALAGPLESDQDKRRVRKSASCEDNPAAWSPSPAKGRR